MILIMVLIMLCLIGYLGRNYIILIWLYSYTFFYQKIDGTTFIPIILDMKIFFIPIQTQKKRFHLVNKGDLTEYEERAVDFLCRYTPKLSGIKSVQVVDLSNFEKKYIALSDL